jgi:hypothetical protein
LFQGKIGPLKEGGIKDKHLMNGYSPAVNGSPVQPGPGAVIHLYPGIGSPWKAYIYSGAIGLLPASPPDFVVASIFGNQKLDGFVAERNAFGNIHQAKLGIVMQIAKRLYKIVIVHCSSLFFFSRIRN